MERVAISKDTLDKVVNYLGRQTYVEVAGLIQEILSNFEILEEDNAEDTEETSTVN